jgi:hypothetical protein
LTPSSSGAWTEKVIYSFQGGNDGQFPSSNLILDHHGNLYGATIYGGGATNAECVVANFGSGCGAVFELTPNTDGSWSEAILYSFQGTPDGAEPTGLVWNGRDTMFGVTAEGLQNANSMAQATTTAGPCSNFGGRLRAGSSPLHIISKAVRMDLRRSGI